MSWRDTVRRKYPEGTLFYISGAKVPEYRFWINICMQPSFYGIRECLSPDELTGKGYEVMVAS